MFFQNILLSLKYKYSIVNSRAYRITYIFSFSLVQQPCTRITKPKLANNLKSTTHPPTVSRWNFNVD
ncbi:hypothetical protein T12_14470 [Trichinella patagoniensis]|uniref:Uncharacterized protein n=1 Tax=Trichinella patagoniensis TaxID=990121 RepID=A0A0V1A9K4_9BILA|nr:hypothetical protein T12_14470 [Trichinella patagoniensis]